MGKNLEAEVEAARKRRERSKERSRQYDEANAAALKYDVVVFVRIRNAEGETLPFDFAPAKRWLGDFKTEADATARVEQIENMVFEKFNPQELD